MVQALSGGAGLGLRFLRAPTLSGGEEGPDGVAVSAIRGAGRLLG